MHLLREYIREALETSPVRQPLDMYIPPDLRALHDTFRDEGEELYIVGGAVRDTLLGKTPKDYDLATGASPEAVLDILSQDPGNRTDLTGKAFGVVRVWTPDGNEYEIATFRKDIGPGRRPEVELEATIEDDVKRRDLTVNALFYDMNTGEVVDYVGGIADIQDRRISAVGDPAERFAEDKLRILRAVRFAGRLGSDLDIETKTAILGDNELTEVSPDRIHDEVSKGIASAQDVAHYFELLESLELYDQLFPGLMISPSTGSNSSSLPVQLALLLVGNDPDQVRSVLRGMRYTNVEMNTIDFLLKFVDIDQGTASDMKRGFGRLKLDPGDLRDFGAAAGMNPRAIDAFLRFAAAPPAGDAKDLMSRGLRGPEVGQAMEDAEGEAYQGMLGELRKYIRESLMYHSTDPDNVSVIQQAGLQTGRESVHTAAGSWADDHYNTRPIYVSVERGKYAGQPLEVDTSGLTLVADLPTLVDSGANVEEEVLWWVEGAEPPALAPFLEMGEIQIFDLLNDPDVIQAAINTTGTAAVLEDIPPDRIRISEVREYIRALLKEDPMGFVHDLAAASDEFGGEGGPFFGGDPGRSGGKAIKRAFAKNADHQFLSTLDTVHWGDVYGLEDLVGAGKDELSTTMIAPGQPLVADSISHNHGLLVKGRITLATNDQDELFSGAWANYTGETADFTEEEQEQRRKSSGINKLPKVSKDYSLYRNLKRGSEFGEKRARNIPYVLDQSTWDPRDWTANEALVDNWKPVAIVASGEDAEYIEDVIRYMEEGESFEEATVGNIKQVFRIAEKFGVPIVDENRNELWRPE